jgi:hypothetical protein
MQQLSPPWGQSFTPSLAGVDFIRLQLNDGQPGAGIGASVHVNLRSTSITGPILGATASVHMLAGFAGYPTFFFSNTVPLTPGITYYMEPIIESGSDFWNVLVSEYGYSGGSYTAGGSPVLVSDLWFREGLYVVPEPATGLLLVVGGALLAGRRLLQRK